MLALYMFDKVYGDYITPKTYEHVSIIPNSNLGYGTNRTAHKDVALFSSSKLTSSRRKFKSRKKW